MATKLKLGTNNNWATKVDKLLAYNDENGNFKPIPFDADRSSTATRVNKAGLVENVEANRPRVQFDGNNGYLLLEPTRTNLIAYSNLDFGTGSVPDGWTVGFGTGTYSHTPTTYKGQPAVIHRQETTGRSYLGVSFTGTNAEHTIRIEFDRSRCLNMEDDDVILFTIGVTNTVTKTWADVDANGILEFQTTFGTDASGELRIGFGVAGNEDGDKTLVWGMPQMELGSYGTSFIKTSGSAVTRTEDFCYIPSGLQNVLNTSEGTLFVDVEVPRIATTSDFDRIVLSDQASSTDRLIFDNFGGNWRSLLLSSGNNVNRTIVSVTANQRIKVAIAYSSTQLRISYDGNAATTTSGTYAPTTTLESLKFSNKDGGSKWQGKIHEVKYFNTALTNAELQALTS